MSAAAEHAAPGGHGADATHGAPGGHTAAQHAGAHHAPSPSDLFLPAANFVVFVVILVYFLNGPVREFFRARAERLRDALEAGARARQEAEALRAQLAADAANLPALRERLRSDLRAAAERERDALVESGRRAAARIREDARLLGEYEVVAARQALRAEVIEEAVRQATAIVQAAVRPEDQERFVRDFVAGAAAGAPAR